MGNVNTLLKYLSSVVLQVHQTLTFNNEQNFKVTGVIRDMPANSHIHSDFFPTMLSDGYQWGQWLSSDHHTYIVLRKGTDYRQFEKNFDAVIQKYVGPRSSNRKYLGYPA